jgi:tetratricopeptide (TPR) repeat protein
MALMFLKKQKKNISNLIRLYIICFSVLVGAQSCSVSRSNLGTSTDNDSTAIYSNHPSRPFKYGYAYDREKSEKFFKGYLEEYNIRNGEVVASIGAASGWIEGGMSIFLDSVIFAIQDIDTSFLNLSQLNKVVSHYSMVRGKPQTNKFYIVIGNEKETNLLDTAFDKIIFNNSFHEIRNVFDIIEDVSKKIKPKGQVIVSEVFSNKYILKRAKGCNIKAYKVKQVVKYFKQHNLYLVKSSNPISALNNTLTFEKDERKSIDYQKKLKGIEPSLKVLYRLYNNSTSSDSFKTYAISKLLLKDLVKINAEYTSIENQINSLGYEWIKKKDYLSAINVLKINVSLYPESSNVYDSLGEAYMLNSQLDLALKNYIKSLEINPESKSGKEKIKKIMHSILKS